MDSIVNNPFRIAGVLAGASEKELVKQKSRFQAFAKVGKQVVSDLDFDFLPPVSRTEQSISDAFASIDQNLDRVHHGIFWFLDSSAIDSTALGHLKNGDAAKAQEIWERATSGKGVNSKNFSAFNNLGTCLLLSENIKEVREGVLLKTKLIESRDFVGFVHAVADQTFTVDSKTETERFIDAILRDVSGKMSDVEIMTLFDLSSSYSREYGVGRIVEKPIYSVEKQIEASKKRRKADKKKGYDSGVQLYRAVKDDLQSLKKLLGKDNLKYRAIADEAANEILQCGIDYFNDSQKSNSTNTHLENAVKLTKMAAKLAVGSVTTDRVNDSLETLSDMRDREINHAIQILKGVKDAYDESVEQIMAQVTKAQSDLVFDLNRTIDWSRVEKAKRECLNWGKVVEVVTSEISASDVDAIRKCSEKNKVEQYKALVEFLVDKLGPLQIQKVKYLCYWKVLGATQAKKAATTASRTVSSSANSVNNATGGCLGAIFRQFFGYIVIGFIFLIISLLSEC